MQYFPLFLDLNNKPVLVIGGGEVASRKVDALLRAGADVTIVSPTIEPFLQRLAGEGKCHWIKTFYSSEYIDRRYIQVWATTDNPDLNHQVHADAKKSGILVNVVDDQPYCDFITPSMITRGRVQLAISSGGASPVLIRNLRETIESVLPQNLGLLADFGASKRNSIKSALPSVDLRRKFWESFLNNPKVEQANSRELLEQLYQSALSESLDDTGQCTWVEYGQDVELLPMKALRLMQQAELVLYRDGCPFSFIDLCRRDAEREGFKDGVELSLKLENAKTERLRIVVLVPLNSSEYALLGADDAHIRPGEIR